MMQNMLMLYKYRRSLDIFKIQWDIEDAPFLNECLKEMA